MSRHRSSKALNTYSPIAKKLLMSLGIISGFATPFYLYNMSMNGLDDLTNNEINKPTQA